MHDYVKECLYYSNIYSLSITYKYIKTRGSESRPRKVELTHAFKKTDDYREYFTHNNETCTCCYDYQPYDSDIH